MIRMIINELKKLFHSGIAIILFALTTVTPLIVSSAPLFASGQSANTAVLLGPVKISALLCSILFAVFMIYEMDRVNRCNVSCIVEPTVSILIYGASKVFAVIAAAFISVMSAGFIYLPYAVHRLGSLFDAELYVFSFMIIMFAAIVFSILLSAGFYMLFRRVDISLLTYSILFFMGCNVQSSYLMSWVQTNIPVYSDCFGNALAFRTALWNRLVWMLLSLSVFVAGILASRRYEKNIFRSMYLNSRKLLLPVSMLILVAVCCVAWIYEPYLDNSRDITYREVTDEQSGMAAMLSTSNMEKNSDIVLEQLNADISIDTDAASLSGSAHYTLRNTSGQKQKLPFSIKPGYSIKSLRINGIPAKWDDFNETIDNATLMFLDLPADPVCNVEIEYGGSPQGWRLFQSNLGGDEVISRDHISLSGKALFPSFNAVTNNCDYTGKITLPSSLTPVTSGGHNTKTAVNNDKMTTTWDFHSMGSVMRLFAGQYHMEKIEAGGIDIEFYYNSLQKEIVEKLKATQLIKEAVDFYTERLGQLDYSPDNPLKIVECSALLLGGNASGNISTIGENIFNPDRFTAHSDEGTNGAQVLVHEICHQWWGIGTKFPQNISKWTSEGLTVYTTNKFLQYKYGDAYAKKIGADTWERGVEALRRSFYYRNPEYRKVIPEKYLFNILSTNNAIIKYSQMPFEIYNAELLLGEEKFKAVLSKLYRRYKNGLGFDDFLRECGLRKEEIAVD